MGKEHFTEKAARRLLRGTRYRSVSAAIKAGVRTEAQWTAHLDRARHEFWSENGRKARAKVKARHPVTPAKKTHIPTKRRNASARTVDKSEARTNAKKIDKIAVQELEKTGKAIAKIGGRASERIDKQAKATYALYLDFIHSVGAHDFARWLEGVSGLPRSTCNERLKRGIELAAASSEQDYGTVGTEESASEP